VLKLVSILCSLQGTSVDVTIDSKPTVSNSTAVEEKVYEDLALSGATADALNSFIKYTKK